MQKLLTVITGIPLKLMFPSVQKPLTVVTGIPLNHRERTRVQCCPFCTYYIFVQKHTLLYVSTLRTAFLYGSLQCINSRSRSLRCLSLYTETCIHVMCLYICLPLLSYDSTCNKLNSNSKNLKEYILSLICFKPNKKQNRGKKYSPKMMSATGMTTLPSWFGAWYIIADHGQLW